MLILACGLAPALSQTDWLKGQEFARAARLTTFDIDWQDAPLKEHVQGLSRAGRMAVMIDRRVDPDLPIKLRMTGSSLPLTLLAAGEPHALAVGRMDGFYYFGPSATALALPQRATDFRTALNQQSVRPAFRSRMLKVVDRWPAEPFCPRDWLRSVLAERSIEVEGWEQIPFDFWERPELPSVPLADLLVAWLAGFGLTPEVVAPEGLEIRAFPESLQGRLDIPELKDQNQSASLVQGLEGIRWQPGSGAAGLEGDAAGLLEVVRRVVRSRGSERSEASNPVLLSLKTTARRLDILEVLARQQRWTLAVPDEARTALAGTVSIDLDQVTATVLMDAVLKGTGWKGVVDGGCLSVVAEGG